MRAKQAEKIAVISVILPSVVHLFGICLRYRSEISVWGVQEDRFSYQGTIGL